MTSSIYKGSDPEEVADRAGSVWEANPNDQVSNNVSRNGDYKICYFKADLNSISTLGEIY